MMNTLVKTKTKKQAPAPQFNRDKCQQRRRVAALRDNIESMPVQFQHGMPRMFEETAEHKYAVIFDAGTVTEKTELHYAQGSLPVDKDAAMAIIWALQPEGAPKLTAGQVFVHFVEAANTNLMSDRHGYMDVSTLRNVAQDAKPGVAYMNSHATGGLSAPAQLPMGRTIAGRFEQFKAEEGKTPFARTILCFYMVADISPNGTASPGTNDLHQMIQGGTLFDVSVGLYPGWALCDVCSNELRSENCTHVPGTTKNMTPDQRTAQKARGVPKGNATYRLMDAHLGELSGVYDGAVPAAGFRKVLAEVRHGDLDTEDLIEIVSAYSKMIRVGDFNMTDRKLVQAVLDVMNSESDEQPGNDDEQDDADENEDESSSESATIVGTLLTQNNAEVDSLRVQLENAQNASRASSQAANSDFVESLVRANVLTPGDRYWALSKLAMAAEADLIFGAKKFAHITRKGAASQMTYVEAAKDDLESLPKHQVLNGPIPVFPVSAKEDKSEEETIREQSAQYARDTEPVLNGKKESK